MPKIYNLTEKNAKAFFLNHPDVGKIKWKPHYKALGRKVGGVFVSGLIYTHLTGCLQILHAATNVEERKKNMVRSLVESAKAKEGVSASFTFASDSSESALQFWRRMGCNNMDLVDIKHLRDESEVFTNATLLGCNEMATRNTNRASRLKNRSAHRESSDSAKSNNSKTDTALGGKRQVTALASPILPSQLDTAVGVKGQVTALASPIPPPQPQPKPKMLAKDGSSKKKSQKRSQKQRSKHLRTNFAKAMGKEGGPRMVYSVIVLLPAEKREQVRVVQSWYNPISQNQLIKIREYVSHRSAVRRCAASVAIS